MVYFQYFLLVKMVCLKAETIVLAVANLLGSIVVIVVFRNLTLMVVNLEPLLFLRYHSTKYQSKFSNNNTSRTSGWSI